MTNLGTTITRRSLVKSLAGIGVTAAVLTPSLGLMSPAAARSSDSLIVNTNGARLRSGPGTGYSTLAYLAKGTEVRFLADGGSANGYRWYKVRVLATGKEGFVASTLLSAPDGGTGSDPVIIGSAVTTVNVNLRSGPSTGYSVIQVIAKGATVTITDKTQNGYRYIYQHSGPAGWVIDSALSRSGQPGETFTTTTNLNLRAEPSTSAKVLLVIPSGATVKALAGKSGSFRQVSYNGVTGWAATAYLN